MVYHFQDELKKSNIEQISKKVGFTNPTYVEKFIMDFEMNYHISTELDSTIRGGMCMPFHTESSVRRLSIDIDLITELETKDVEKIMNKLNQKLTTIKIKKFEPINPYPIPNLLSFDIEYQSCFGKLERIKVDYLCKALLKLPTQLISNKREIIEFKIDYPLKILTRGALIGDKITTLSLEKIGLRKKKFFDIPKQIHDISALLKTATEEDLEQSLKVFENLTNFKIKIFAEGKYRMQEIIDTINSSIQNLLLFKSTLTITDEYEGLFGSFKGTYLNTTNSYKKTQHISDILLTWMYAVFLKKSHNKLISNKDAAKKVFKIIETYNVLIEEDADKKHEIREDVLKEMPELPFRKKILNGPPVEQVYLIKKIFQN